jgi:hypothetical protein
VTRWLVDLACEIHNGFLQFVHYTESQFQLCSYMHGTFSLVNSSLTASEILFSLCLNCQQMRVCVQNGTFAYHLTKATNTTIENQHSRFSSYVTCTWVNELADLCQCRANLGVCVCASQIRGQPSLCLVNVLEIGGWEWGDG